MAQLRSKDWTLGHAMVIFQQPKSKAIDRKTHRFITPIFAGTIFLLFLAHRPCFAANPPTDRTPIQAELVKAIEAGRVQVGDAVYAKVDLAWNNSACKLREGAILKGRIVTESPRSKGGKPSGIALLFDSGQCGGRTQTQSQKTCREFFHLNQH